ncbi:RNA polymerase sigma factor [Streptomyces silaceus]|uniref:RNA polymerase sigma factor n=1 Tax=Streptomyces silaceus TaxID=545123 RepID=UPI000B1AF032|nr:RNA polymerase sigma factor [Streptomyces silaceus]
MRPIQPLTDAQLTLRAQAGETGALGLLLARHQASMRAVALRLLGHGPDAEDVVQDAALTALRRIGDVRNPAAVGAWLRAIVRNNARMHLRADREVPGIDGLDHLHPHRDEHAHDTCEHLVEQHALRDWIWDAIAELPPKLRLVVMLRYFTSTTSYEEIATACDIPMGTVRSRLSQARAKLARLLLRSATETHDDAVRRTEASGQEALTTLKRGRAEPYPGPSANCGPRRARWSADSTTRASTSTPFPSCAPPGGRRTPAPAPRSRRKGHRHPEMTVINA